MKQRDSYTHFLCNTEWCTTLNKLPDDVRLRVYDALFSYAATREYEALDLLGEVAFEPIKNEVMRYLDKYAITCERRRQNIAKRWAATQLDEGSIEGVNEGYKCIQKDTNVYKRIQMGRNPNPNPNPNPNVTNVTNLKENLLTQVKESAATAAPSPPVSQSKKSFIAPTEEEVATYMQQYAQQRQLPFNRRDAEQCYAYYESNGWIVGRGNKMKDWRAAARGWLLRGATAPPRAAPYNSSKVDNVHFTGEGNRSIYDHEEERWQQPLSSDNRRYDNEQDNWQTKQTKQAG